MDVCVFIRGEVSTKIYQAWETNIPKRFPGSTVRSSFCKTCKVVVVGRSCTEEAVRSWMKGERLDHRTVIAYSDWVVKCLKEGKMCPFDDYAAKTLMDNLGHEQGSTSSQLSLTSQPPAQLPGSQADYKFQLSHAASPLRDAVQERAISQALTDFDAPSQTESHDADKTNRNKHITDILDELQAMYLQMGDQFRAQNYKKSSNQLKRMRHIQSASELDGITGFGKSLKTTIQEILNTGALKKLSHLKKNPRSTAITLLSDIWGVGEKTAEQLYNQGYHTVEDLRSRGKHLLNRQQLIGLAHYEEFLTRIPREEVEFIGQIVEEECRRIEPLVEYTVCGSYRRGKADCGDVDILITPSADNPQESLQGNTLSRLIQALEHRGFLTDHLSLPTGHKEYVSSSALEQIRRVSTAGGGGAYAPSKASRRSGSSQHSVRSPVSTQRSISNLTAPSSSSSQAASSLLSHQSSPGALEPTQLDADGAEGSDADLPSGSEEEFAVLSEDERSDWEGGSGSQSGEEAEEGVKYDTYGGKKKKTTHRLYFGSRGSYMGVCKVPRPSAIHRRIDIKVYPRSQRAFALFYFTGSDSYNRGVRYYVSKNGYALDDKGLMYCVRDDKNKIVSRGELVPCATERDICEHLGIEYREPWDRGMFDPKTMVLRPLQPPKHGKWSATWRNGRANGNGKGNGNGNGNGEGRGDVSNCGGNQGESAPATSSGAAGASTGSGAEVQPAQPAVEVVLLRKRPRSPGRL